MIRALLDGRKTMTRRLAWKTIERGPKVNGLQAIVSKASTWQKVKPGDRLWVRESWCRFPNDAPDGQGEQVYYLADQTALPEVERIRAANKVRGRPSIHMPRKFSRITLDVSATKIERLQVIAWADAINEGCWGKLGPNPDFPNEWDPSPPEEFRDLWRSLHGADSWDANPEVVAISFKVHHCNVDQMKDAA
jgi:hypothetical protein